MRIYNKSYKIENSINKTILLISDIHYQNKRDINVLNKVLDNIKKDKPDFICIPGDIINCVNVSDEKELINWFKKVSKISTVIISIGNHEYYVDRKTQTFGFNNKLFDSIKNIDNIYVLDNDSVVIDGINFIGITFSKEYYFTFAENEPQFNKYLKNIKINKKYYNVLLCHSPLRIINDDIIYKVGADLILCGHTHGGMIPNIFRPFIKHAGLLSPTKTLFPKYTYGKIKKGNATIITTRGICVLPRKLGLLTSLYKGEVVRIKISND